jgi:hypothetical protein
MEYLKLPEKDCLNWKFMLTVVVFVVIGTIIYINIGG